MYIYDLCICLAYYVPTSIWTIIDVTVNLYLANSGVGKELKVVLGIKTQKYQIQGKNMYYV